MLEVKNIHKKFGSNEVLKGVDFKVEKGSVIAVLGNSGSGKTTLLRCISFLEQADKGEITFDDFQRMIDGEDPSRADGVVGTGMKDTDPNLPDEYKDLVSEDLEGFVVMFVKANCDNCSSIQSYLETWFNQFNNEDGINNRLRLFTIDVSFVPDDSSKSTEAEGSANNYENENITLEQQNDMMSYMKDTYLNQDDAHRVSEVTESTFEMDLTSPSGSGTIPTPTFVLYTKNKDEEKYDIANPTKVICGAIGDLNYTSQADMNSQMLDVFDFVVYSERAN